MSKTPYIICQLSAYIISVCIICLMRGMDYPPLWTLNISLSFVDIIRLVASYGCFEGERVLITEKKNHTIYHTKHHLLRNYSWSCHTNWSLLLTKSICFMEVLCAWMSANVHFVDIYWTKWKQTIDKLPVVILIYSAEARRDITIL